jgi:hypothetical protein
VCAFPPSPMFVLLTFSCLLVSSMCVLFRHQSCLFCSLFLIFSTLACMCSTPITHVCCAHLFSLSHLEDVCAFPLLPMFVLFPFSHILVSRMYVPPPHRPCLSCSLFLTFLSLASACFSPIAHVCLAHCFLPSCLWPVCAFPLSLMFVWLTFSCLLVSSLCVLFPYDSCLSDSLFLAFSSLGSGYFSPITHV